MVTFFMFGQPSSDLILLLSLKLGKLLEPVGHKLINQSLDKTDSFTIHKVFHRYLWDCLPKMVSRYLYFLRLALWISTYIYWNKVFLLNLVKESVEDRQVQHTGESNATSAALAPNVACHKCLARESNPWHLCSNQGILPLDYWDG